MADSSKKDTILIICAHPDDEVLGVGGTIAKYSREGKRVIAAVMSYGEKSHWWMKKRYTVEMRVKESKTAGKMLGTAETVFLGLKDFELKEELSKKKNIAVIEKLIKKYSPSKIFTHSPDDMIYSDHKAVWDAVDKAVKHLSYQGDIYVFNIWAKDIRLGQNPKLVVDISDTFSLKLKALTCFQSQHKYIFQLYPGLIWRAFRSGLENRCRFAEIFNKVG